MKKLKVLKIGGVNLWQMCPMNLRTPLTTINGVIQGIRNDMIPEDRKRKRYAVSEQRNESISFGL